jgi:DNA-binding NarL/FixJ family response regulator
VDSYESQLQGEGSPVRTLSRRELEVLRLASGGSTNHEIGEQLGLSVHAVKFHLASVYRKLGVANRTEAAVLLMTGLASADVQGKE